jgi:hypothetical protein
MIVYERSMTFFLTFNDGFELLSKKEVNFRNTVIFKKISRFDAYSGSADPDRICVSL